jgi:hypothetical protein
LKFQIWVAAEGSAGIFVRSVVDLFFPAREEVVCLYEEHEAQ